MTATHEKPDTAMKPSALNGVRILDFTRNQQGPFATLLLCDMGAEVIKVEPPGGEPGRSSGLQPDGFSSYFEGHNRGKKSITLDFKRPGALDVVKRLIPTVDVVVENFRPGTLERWNMSYEQLSKENPKLVMVRVSGYGQTGPYAQRAGFGAIGEAMGGLRYVVGDPSMPPSRMGISIGDSLAATYAALGAMMAIHARTRTGRGQLVDSAIYEAVLAMMESLLPEWKPGTPRLKGYPY